jgi:thiosulfate dehydrogenase [quinone] large subunit
MYSGVTRSEEDSSMFKDNKAVAYLLMRLALGVNIFGHGFFRLLSGLSAFVHGAAIPIDKGPLPHSLTIDFLYAVPFIEVALGLLLIVGLWTRIALILGQLNMIGLVVGVTSVQNWTTATTQLEYSFVFFAMLWLVEANTISVDGLMGRKNV